MLADADDVALDAGARSPGAWLAHQTRSGRARGDGGGAARRGADGRGGARSRRRWRPAGHPRAGPRDRPVARRAPRRPGPRGAAEGGGAPARRGRPLRPSAAAGARPQGPGGAGARPRRGGGAPPARGRGARRPPHHAAELAGPRRRLHRHPHPGARPRRGPAEDLPGVHDRARATRPSVPTTRSPACRTRGGSARRSAPCSSAFPAKLLPQHGGTATTVMVTIPFEQLRSRPRRGRPRHRGPDHRRPGTTARLHGGPDSRRARRRPPRCSTSAAPAGCSRRPSARRWPSATRSAARRAARSPPPGARPITGSPGAGAGGRT